MIRVEINTLVADRTPIPQDLVGLADESLRNLQTALNPVPDQHVGFEYWDEVDNTPSIDPRYQVVSGEILTPDSNTKTVGVVKTLSDRPNSEVNQYLRSTVMARLESELSKDYDIGGGNISNLKEIMDNKDLLDGSEDSFFNFKTGPVKLTITQQASLKNAAKTRRRSIQLRGHTIAILIKNASSLGDKITALDAEIDTGWPT